MYYPPITDIKLGNETFAKFMGREAYAMEGMYCHEDCLAMCSLPERLKYNSNYEWLIQVVIKVESLGFPVMIYKNTVTIDFFEGGKFKGPNKHSTLYNVLFHFINWYNQNKKP